MKRRMNHFRKANQTFFPLNNPVPLIVIVCLFLLERVPSSFRMVCAILFPHDFFIRVVNPVKRRCRVGFQSSLPLVQCTISYLKTHYVVNFTNYCTPNYISIFKMIVKKLYTPIIKLSHDVLFSCGFYCSTWDLD